MKRIAAAVASIVALLITAYLSFWPRGFEVVPMTTVHDAGLFRFLRHHGEIEVEVVQEGSGQLGVSRYDAVDPGWEIGIAMLPGTGVGGDDDASPFASRTAFMGWFDDGTPVIGHRLNATSVHFPGDIGFGSNDVHVGDSSWQLVCIPKASRSVHLVRLATDATTNDIATAVASIPANARWSAPQIAGILQFIIGTREQAYAAYLEPRTMLSQPAGQAELTKYRQTLLARAAAFKPVLVKWVGLADATTGLTADYGSAGFSPNSGRWEYRQRTLSPGQSIDDTTLDRILWMLAALDPANWNSAALARMSRPQSTSAIADMVVRTGHLPPGSGLGLAKRWLADLPAPLPPETRDTFYLSDSPIQIMLRAHFDPATQAEADLFLDEVAVNGPDLLVESVFTDFVMEPFLSVPADRAPTPEALVAAINGCKWERVRAAAARNALNNPQLPGYFQQRLELDGEMLRVRAAP